jgi:hypothetical protein
MKNGFRLMVGVEDGARVPLAIGQAVGIGVVREVEGVALRSARVCV